MRGGKKIISGVGEGGGALPPTFGHVCTLIEEKISSFSLSATNVKQLNHNF